MIDWTAISDNPVSPEVLSSVRSELLSRRRSMAGSMNFLREFVSGQRVLDIGVVEHDVSHMDSPNWKHRYIQHWAISVLGIDIIPEAVALLNARGFNVRVVDATSQQDLGERFDRVVIGDVIEHVNRPVELLSFAARHLTPEGRIFVSTPNPYWIVSIWKTFRGGTFLTNELGRRAGLNLHEYWLLQGESVPAKRLSRRVANWLFPDSELFSSKYFYIYTKME
jgi:SAM-dependent methyltransferase